MPLKITAGPVVLLTSKNDQKKVFILGHFLVTLALLPPGLVASQVSGVSAHLFSSESQGASLTSGEYEL